MTVQQEPIPPLTDLQQWNRSDWERFEPCLFKGSPSPKRVIQTIIRAADRVLYWRGEANANSLRDFWYNPVKPVVERVFPHKLEDDSFDFVRRMSQYLSDTLSEMVQDEEVSYRSLNILDESRERELHLESPENQKILFVEKEAAYRKLRPLEQVYELSIVSGGGWQATALIEDLAHELDPGTEYTLFVLTDYDPTGWEIARDFRRRSERLGVTIESVEHVGILPRQLDAETVANQRFSPPINSDRDRDWLRRNGIDGRYGLEIEAIGDLNQKGEALRQVVVDELRDQINVRDRRRRDTSVALATGVQTGVTRVFQALTADLEDVIREAAIEAVREKDGVRRLRFDPESVEYRAIADLDRADDGRAWLPDPYSGSDLHDGAVEGEVPEVDESAVVEYALQAIRDQINAGEFDPVTLVGGAGDLGGDE